jgi:hypothetical protein
MLSHVEAMIKKIEKVSSKLRRQMPKTQTSPHNIDVMHTEKNFAEALWTTLMDIPNKTKDNPKARVDMTTLCDRLKLQCCFQETANHEKGLRPITS